MIEERRECYALTLSKSGDRQQPKMQAASWLRRVERPQRDRFEKLGHIPSSYRTPSSRTLQRLRPVAAYPVF
jgi:hypothetical protein